MRKLNLAASLGFAGLASLWLGQFQGPTTVLGGFVVLFLILRGISVREVIATALGAGAAAFILPISLWGAMAAFALVQVLAELRSREKRFVRDRFQEGKKTAERILGEIA